MASALDTFARAQTLENVLMDGTIEALDIADNIDILLEVIAHDAERIEDNAGSWHPTAISQRAARTRRLVTIVQSQRTRLTTLLNTQNNFLEGTSIVADAA